MKRAFLAVAFACGLALLPCSVSKSWGQDLPPVPDADAPALSDPATADTEIVGSGAAAASTEGQGPEAPTAEASSTAEDSSGRAEPTGETTADPAAPAKDSAEVLRALQEAKQELTAEQHLLRYKYAKGETIRYQVEQLVTIDTTISGNRQETKLQSRSGRTLQVQEVDASGQMRFTNTIDYVDMWSEVSGRQAVKYDSRKDKEAPAEYQVVASHVGKPISVITLSPTGQIVERRDEFSQPELGLGGVSIPLPDGPVSIGHVWSQPMELKVRTEDQRVKVVKTREVYRLERVETGVATISLKTEVLTPLDDARVKSQIIQRISQGEIRFDLDAGRLLSKQLDWDESVVGFAGAESNMKYLARFTETLDRSAPVSAAARPAKTR